MPADSTPAAPLKLLLNRIPPAFWVFLAAFLCQFVVLNFIASSRHFLPDSDDMKFYDDWAHKLTGEMQWKKNEPNYPGTAFYGMPGYSYTLAAIYTVTGGYSHEYSPYLIGQLQAVFHALTGMFIFLLARAIFGEKRRGTVIGAIAAAGWVAFTPAQVFSAILMPTAWIVCAFWGVVYWLVRVVQSGRVSWWRPWLWMGLIMGVVALMVASILMLIPLVIVAIALTAGRGRGLKVRVLSAAGAVVVLLCGVYTGCSPAWVHNYFYAHDRVLFSAHDGLNYYLGNHSEANGFTKIPSTLRATQEGLLRDSLSIPERELGRPLKRSEVSAFWKAKGQAFIREHPIAWMRLMALKFQNFWNNYQYDDLSILKLLRDEGVVPPGIRFGFAGALALPALVLGFWRWPRSRWVVAACLFHMGAVLMVFVTERYRMAAAPGLLLLGAGGLYFLWENLASRRWLTAAAYLAALAGAGWFASAPQSEIGLYSLDYYKAGKRSTEGAQNYQEQNGDSKLITAFLANAQRNLETAYRYVPTSPENSFALGNVWMTRGDLARAETCYLRAIALSAQTPHPHDGALNNLGVVYYQQKRWADAEALFDAAVKLNPENAKTWYLLALALKEQGKLAPAAAALAEAIRLEPQRAEFLKLRDALASPKP